MWRANDVIFWAVVAATLVVLLSFGFYTDMRSCALQKRVDALIKAEELKDDQKTQGTGVPGLRP